MKLMFFSPCDPKKYETFQEPLKSSVNLISYRNYFFRNGNYLKTSRKKQNVLVY